MAKRMAGRNRNPENPANPENPDSDKDARAPAVSHRFRYPPERRISKPTPVSPLWERVRMKRILEKPPRLPRRARLGADFLRERGHLIALALFFAVGVATLDDYGVQASDNRISARRRDGGHPTYIPKPIPDYSCVFPCWRVFRLAADVSAVRKPRYRANRHAAVPAASAHIRPLVHQQQRRAVSQHIHDRARYTASQSYRSRTSAPNSEPRIGRLTRRLGLRNPSPNPYSTYTRATTAWAATL